MPAGPPPATQHCTRIDVIGRGSSSLHPPMGSRLAAGALLIDQHEHHRT
jgi:hypothetical protein